MKSSIFTVDGRDGFNVGAAAALAGYGRQAQGNREGMPSKVKDLLRKPWRVAENRWLRLFIKNAPSWLKNSLR